MIARKILFLCLAGGLAGCRAAASPSEPVVGVATLTLVRGPAALPGQATEALVRVWNPGTAFSSVQRVTLPAPGSGTNVTFPVPAGTGYRAGVIALGSGEAVAAGTSATFSVAASGTSQVTVDTQPWQLTILQAPDTFVSGASATIRARITGAPVVDVLAERFGATLCLQTAAFATPCPVGTPIGGQLRGDSITVTFNAPTVSAQGTVYFQFTLGIDGRTGWTPENVNVGASVHLPSFVLGGQLLTRPIKTSSGTVVIVVN